MIKFEHTMTQPEVESTYINLKDDYGNQYGDSFPSPKTKLLIIDQENRSFPASKHHRTQIWGASGIRDWFRTNNIKTETTVLIRYDPNELSLERMPIIHIDLENEEPPEPEPGTRAVEIPVEFERQLEAFLELNLNKVELGLELFVDEEEHRGRQYPTDVGNIDLLCVKPDGNFVVIELKKGRESDRVVGQISRYMGWVKEILAQNSDVYGIIITHEYDERLKYAALANEKIKLLYYKVLLEFTSEEEIRKTENASL